MSLKYLGDTLDIHGGGQDLIFPHHENEIAQSEAFTGVTPFVRHWLHNGLMQLGEEKMSKSLGNLITVKEALERYSADGIRLFILSSHYRSPLTYSEEGLAAAERGVERLRLAARPGRESGLSAIDVTSYRQRFTNAMDDDFNTAQALSALFDLAREINKAKEAATSTSEARATLIELAGVLGLTLPSLQKRTVALDAILITQEQKRFTDLVDAICDELKSEQPSFADRIDVEKSLDIETNINLLVSIRDDLRLIRQFDLADKIRADLGELGVILEDTPEGTVWRYKR
jgi:cysteinyl-tRNA synthetase